MSLTQLLLAATSVAFAQLSPSGELSSTDRPLFQTEVLRLNRELAASIDKAAVQYQIARTWASAKQWPEAIDWLRKTPVLNAGFDPARDPIFADIRLTREFQEVEKLALALTPPVSHSSAAFEVEDLGLQPESIAFDTKSQQFYLGSMNKGKVLRCSPTGVCQDFRVGLGTVLGIKVNGDRLSLLNNRDNRSELIQFDLRTAKEVGRYDTPDSGHLFNDLAFARNGDAFVSDTRGARVWKFDAQAKTLKQLPYEFRSANGIALSPDARLLYVSTYPDGISVLNLETKTAAPIARPSDLCLAMIDGLYVHKGSLIAIQNGFMSPRVVRLTLGNDRRSITRYQVLERRNPVFDSVTTGVTVKNNFYYMANIQDGKTTDIKPITILKLPLTKGP